MNILIWVLQVLLALWNIIGGVYTMFNYQSIKSAWASDLPQPVWIGIGGLQVLFALGLVLPSLFGGLSKLTSVSAIYLALNALAGLALAAKYAGFPGMLWGVIPAILCALVAYVRTAA